MVAGDYVAREITCQTAKLAAQDLQKHLKLMSGAELPIVPAPSVNVPSQVYVGASEITRKRGFRPAGFTTSGLEILAEKNHVILAGPDKQRPPSPYSQAVQDSRYLSGQR